MSSALRYRATAGSYSNAQTTVPVVGPQTGLGSKPHLPRISTLHLPRAQILRLHVGSVDFVLNIPVASAEN